MMLRESRLRFVAEVNHIVRVFDVDAFGWRFRANDAIKRAALMVGCMQEEIDHLKRTKTKPPELIAHLGHVAQTFDVDAKAWRRHAQQTLKETSATIRTMQDELDYLKRKL